MYFKAKWLYDIKYLQRERARTIFCLLFVPLGMSFWFFLAYITFGIPDIELTGMSIVLFTLFTTFILYNAYKLAKSSLACLKAIKKLETMIDEENK